MLKTKEKKKMRELPQYSADIVMIPTFAAVMRCPKCDSRNIRTFPDVQFMNDDFPENSTNFIHIQGQCNDCKTMLSISPRIYMIDTMVSEPPDDESSVYGEKISEYGVLHFAGTLVDVGGDSVRAEPEEEHRCEWCKMSYHTERGLNIHKAHCHSKPEEVKKQEEEEEKQEEQEEEDKIRRADWYLKHKERIEESNKRDLDADYPHECKCGESFTNLRALKKHKKTCEVIAEQKKKLPAYSKEQDLEAIDKSIIYTHSDTTPMTLWTEYGINAYRKEITRCPHCDYEMDDWDHPPHVKEVCFWVDIISPDFFFRDPRECAVLISECPQCFKKSMGHPMMKTLLWHDWFDKAKIIDVLVERGFIREGTPEEEAEDDWLEEE